MLVLGLDPLRFLYTHDEMERQLLMKIKDEAFELKETLDQRLAVKIAHEVSKMFK